MGSPKFLSAFKKEVPLEKRQELNKRIKEKYPNRLPVIIEVHQDRFTKPLVLSKTKYLVGPEMTFSSLLYELRKHIYLIESHESLFLFVNESLVPPNTSMIGQIYDQHKDSEDNFLYLILTKENTFG